MRLPTILVLLIAGALTGAETYRSPMALVGDAVGSGAFVAEHDSNRITEVDLKAGSVRRSVALPDHPTALALARDGSALFVAAGDERGAVHRIALPAGTVTASWPVGHTPTALVVSGDGRTLYACCRFADRIEVLDSTSGTVTARIPVPREPVAAALGVDGRLVVANHLPAGRADGDTVAAVVSIIDTTTKTVAAEVPLPNGSTSLRGVACSPDGTTAYVTHLLGRYQQPTTQLERGWMNTNALSIIDVRAGKLVATVLLDNVEQGAANPWGVTLTGDGSLLCVAHAGSHEVSVIDREALMRKLATPAGRDTSDNLTFLNGLQWRVPVPGRGPRAILSHGSQVVVAAYYGDQLDVVDTAAVRQGRAQAPGTVTSITLGEAVPMSSERRGEMAFNDASRCFQRWQSCASCHPDGRTDGLNWDLLNDGIGNPKNTRNMLGVTKRSPVMSLGVRESPEKAVRAGFKFIQFTTVEDQVIADVMAYLASMTPVPSPKLVDGHLSPAGERGKALFESVGCIDCHRPPLYTNQKKYDFGFGTGLDAGKPFVVPPLIEVWRTAPYLHDGRAATLRDVLTTADPDGKHTQSKDLKPQELDDLLEFVGSL